MSTNYPKIKETDTNCLVEIRNDIPFKDVETFRNRICELLEWSLKMWEYKLYGNTKITRAEKIALHIFFTDYKLDRQNFLSNQYLFSHSN